MTDRKREELQEAIKIVGPVAAQCGVSEKDIENLCWYFDEMSIRSVSARDAAHSLRVFMKNKEGSKW